MWFRKNRFFKLVKTSQQRASNSYFPLNFCLVSCFFKYYFNYFACWNLQSVALLTFVLVSLEKSHVWISTSLKLIRWLSRITDKAINRHTKKRFRTFLHQQVFWLMVKLNQQTIVKEKKDSRRLLTQWQIIHGSRCSGWRDSSNYHRKMRCTKVGEKYQLELSTTRERIKLLCCRTFKFSFMSSAHIAQHNEGGQKTRKTQHRELICCSHTWMTHPPQFSPSAHW